MLKIISAPNPILSQIAKPVYKVDANVLKLINEMKGALLWAKDPIGVGLAAPQVNRSLQIFIAKPTLKSPIQVFINPKKIPTDHKQIDADKDQRGSVSKSVKSPTKLEGCLSLPAIWGPVLRSSSIAISYLDEHGKSHKKKFSNFLSTIIQHEMDHLQGTLFPKRVLEQKGTLYKSHKNEKGEDVFEEIEI